MGMAIPVQPNSQSRSGLSAVQDVQFRLETLQKTLSAAPIQNDVLTALSKTINSFIAFTKDEKSTTSDSQALALAQQFASLLSLIQKSDPGTFASISSLMKDSPLEPRSFVSSGGTPTQASSVTDTRASLLSKAGIDTSKTDSVQKKIFQILIGGIENLGELTSILDLVGDFSSLVSLALLNTIGESIKEFALEVAGQSTSISDLQNKMSGIASVLREKGDAMVALKLDPTDILLSPELQQVIKLKFGDNVSITGSGTISKTSSDPKNKSDSLKEFNQTEKPSALFPDQALKKQDLEIKEKQLLERLGTFNGPNKSSEPRTSSGQSELGPEAISSKSKLTVPKLSALKAEDPFATPIPGAVESESSNLSLVTAVQPTLSSQELSKTAEHFLQRLTEAKTEKEVKNILKNMLTSSSKSESSKTELKSLMRSPQVSELLKPNRFKELNKSRQMPQRTTDAPRVIGTQKSSGASKSLAKRGGSLMSDLPESEEESSFLLLSTASSVNPEMMTSTIAALMGPDARPWSPNELKSKPGSTESTLINLRTLGDSYFRGKSISSDSVKSVIQENPAQLADFLEAIAGSLAEKIIGGALRGS